MGKRELGLILGFIVLGVVVWQFTAPKAEGEGFSIRRLISDARREMQPRNASAEITTNPAIPFDASINEVRLTLSAGGTVLIKAEDRNDIGAELKVVSDGVDDAEARKLAGESGLKVSRFADSVVVGWTFPEPGRQVPSLTLLVPRRMRIQLDGRGTATVTGVGGVTLARQSGVLTLESIAGTVKGESRGTVTVNGAEAMDLSIANNETVVKGVRGEVKLNVRSGEVRMEKTAAPVTVTGTDVRVRMDGVGGDVRLEIVDGDIELNGVNAALDIDGRSTPITIDWLKAMTAKIQVRDGSLDLELPKDAGAYSLDVRASDGEVRVPDQLQKTTEGSETVVMKSAAGSAASIFVRGTGATITIR